MKEKETGGSVMRRWLLAAVLVLGWIPFMTEARAGAGFRHLLARDQGDGDGGIHIDLRMNEIRATPIRAHVGDVIRIDLVIENRGEGYETVSLDVLANKRWVAGKLFTYGGGTENRLYRETLYWDTRGVQPGEYRIRAELVLPYDASPFDTFIDLKQPVVLLPAGAPEAGAGQPGTTGGY